MARHWTDTAQVRCPIPRFNPTRPGTASSRRSSYYMIAALCGNGFGPGPARTGPLGTRP